MKSIESSAKTIEDAIRQGLTKLDVSLGDVTIDILHEGSKGLFGIMGTKDAKVRLTVKEDDQVADILSTLSVEEPKAKPQAQAKQPRKARQPKPPKQTRAEKKQEKPKQQDTKPKAQPSTKPSVKVEKAPAPKEAPKVAPKAAPKEPLKEYPHADAATAEGKAQEFLMNVTKLMNLDIAVEAGKDDEGNVQINMHGDTLGILIGRRGETLDALQYLTSLNVNHGQDNYTRVTLDTENYRAKREEALKRLANRMANRAVKTGRKVVLEPMNPYERRILHSALQQNNAVTTHSEGDEPNRRVVISLK